MKLNRANYYARRASRATDTIELDAIVLQQTVNRTQAHRIYIFNSVQRRVLFGDSFFKTTECI